MDPNVPNPQIPQESIFRRASRYLKNRYPCTVHFLASVIVSKIPILSWLPQYRLSYLLRDIIAGISIFILHIPQGLAYGMLAQVQPVNGLYVSFFPVIIYFLLGTSHHISIGTMSVVSLMAGGTVSKVAIQMMEVTYQNSTDNSSIPPLPIPTHLEIVTTLAIEVGFLQMFMGIFNFGLLTVVFSDPLVSGFIIGAAVHVVTSQWKYIFDISVKNYTGALQIIYIYEDIFKNLKNTNLVTLLIAVIAIVTLLTVKIVLDKRCQAKCEMPCPIDLIVVVIATTASYLGKFNKNYGVHIMMQIPTGIPTPKSPRFDLFKLLISDSFAIAIVSYSISLTMAKLFAKQNIYVIDPNQELFAIGLSNVFSSFFACFPCCASLARTVMQDKAGGITQITSLVSSCLILSVLFYLGPLFDSLPDCILSAIIIVALKSFFAKIADFPNMYRISKIDASIWMVAVLSTVFLDVITGLFFGITYSLLTVIFRIAIPSTTLLGKMQDSDRYVDCQSYIEAQEITSIKIFHFESPLCFINTDRFKSSLYKMAPLQNNSSDEETIFQDNENINCIIIDCSSISFTDLSGLGALLEVMKAYNGIGINVYLACCSVGMIDKIMRSEFIEKVTYQPFIFLTIDDVVEYHREMQQMNSS